VAIATEPDGDAWFSDEGSTPAIGRVTPDGQIREFSAGLLPGSDPALIAPGPGREMWFTDEGAVAAVGHVQTGSPAQPG
jgi:streptogramin lyase